MDFHPHKNYLATQYKILFPPTVDPLHQSGMRSSQEADAATIYTSETSQATYDQHAHPLSDLQVGNHVAVQNPTSKMWDIYGTITAVGPYRRYFIKTQSGRILVRNWRFIRKRSPLSIAGPSPSLPPNPPEPHRSARTSHRPLSYQRIQHGSSAPLLTHQSLVGRCKVMNSVTLMLFAIQWY